MNWTPIINEIFSQSPRRIFCIHSPQSVSTQNLKKLTGEIKRSHYTKEKEVSWKVNLLTSRADYIRRHQHEGLFFQQRFQASWKDEGETVKGRLSSKLENSEQKDWINRFDIMPLWNKPLLQLSSGEWQRFSLADGLLFRPHVLIVPELLKGLDIRWQERMLEVLTGLSEPPYKIIFTSVLPVHHSAVVNIKLEDGGTEPSHRFTAVSNALIKQIHHYQNTFLDASASEPHIRMNGVHIQYGDKKILNDIHWTVYAGEKWNITGANGAGKSTLLSLVNADNPQGYSQPIELFGKRYRGLSIWERKARIAYFGSDYFQYYRSSGTVDEVLRKQLTTPYLDTVQPPRSLVEALLEHFCIADILQQKFSVLSTGVRRQILLVAAYLKSSQILVLDEPFHDMPADLIRLNIDFLEAVQPGSFQTVLFVTHRDDHRPVFLKKMLRM